MGQERSKEHIRNPSVAGTFYPGSAGSLKKEIQVLFSQAARRSSKKRIRAIIVPHAGYLYSGKVAASAFNQLDRNNPPKTVVVIASSHHANFNGAAICKSRNYFTPLGTVKTDHRMAETLIEENDFFTDFPEAHDAEHSLETQVPFLQYVYEDYLTIVPILIGTQDITLCEKIGKALRPLLNDNTLFVISSDFSHYPSYHDAVITDKLTASAILKTKPDELINALKMNSEKHINGLATSLCGWTSVLSFLYMIEGVKMNGVIHDYANSGDINGDHSKVVGYYAIGFYE